MGCTKVGHHHVWPTEGLLVIQRCEIRCNFCLGEAGFKNWKYAWFLRRHVRAIHVGNKSKRQYPNLIVDDSWDDSKLHHIELKKLLKGKKPSDIKYVEQPEFEEQRVGGVFHLGSSFIKRETNGDGDLYNGGAHEFYFNEDGAYPAFAEEEAALSIQNPFEVHDIENFLFNTVLGQTEFAEFTEDDEQPTGLMKVDDQDQTTHINENINGAPKSLTAHRPLEESLTANKLHSDYAEQDGLTKPEPDWDGAPRFFMEDYDYESVNDEHSDGLDDLPLAQVVNHYQVTPSLDQYGRILSMLDTGAEQMMANEGLQPADMLPCIAMFARGLMSRNKSRENDTA